jgi:cyclopropane-fatty-acyl-phospholipid synthase
MARLGLSEQSDLRLEDYREHSGRDYDALLSIEMFEAVGEAYWPAYFQTVFAALKPGGRAALQIITINDSDFDDYRRNPDFIQRYVFPGGMLATLRHLRELSAEVGLQWRDAFSLRESYARTLLTWRERFWAAWPEIETQGFDARFWRLWTYYLTYCASGFEENIIDVYQILMQKPER